MKKPTRKTSLALVSLLVVLGTNAPAAVIAYAADSTAETTAAQTAVSTEASTSAHESASVASPAATASTQAAAPVATVASASVAATTRAAAPASAATTISSLSFTVSGLKEPALGEAVPDQLVGEPQEKNGNAAGGEQFVTWRVKQADGRWDYADPYGQGVKFEEGKEYRLRFDIQGLQPASGKQLPDTAPTITVNGMDLSVVTTDGVTDSYYTKASDGSVAMALYTKAFKVSQTGSKPTPSPTLTTIYVKTAAPAGGDGSEAHPFNDFKEAYKAVQANGTIVLLNNVTIQNDDNGSDTGVFSFNKAVSIEGKGQGSALSSRVPVQLGANTALKELEFSAPTVFLNGHVLSMDKVKNNSNNASRPTVYGGSHAGTTASGTHSKLQVTGYVQSPFEFANVFAGSETGSSQIAATFTLESGAKVLGALDASGKTARVNAPVIFVVGKASVPQMLNTHDSADTTLKFKDHSDTNSPEISGFKNVSLENSQITETVEGKLASVSGRLSLDKTSVVDISAGDAELTVGELQAESGSRVVLNKDKGHLHVNGMFEGALELRTPSADAATSGVVVLDHPYLAAAKGSTGTVSFKAFMTQDNVEMFKKETDQDLQWVAQEKKDEPGNTDQPGGEDSGNQDNQGGNQDNQGGNQDNQGNQGGNQDNQGNQGGNQDNQGGNQDNQGGVQPGGENNQAGQQGSNQDGSQGGQQSGSQVGQQSGNHGGTHQQSTGTQGTHSQHKTHKTTRVMKVVKKQLPQTGDAGTTGAFGMALLGMLSAALAAVTSRVRRRSE